MDIHFSAQENGLMVGQGMKRLMVIDSSFGNADVQRARFTALAA